MRHHLLLQRLALLLAACGVAGKRTAKEAEERQQKRVVDHVLNSYEQDDLYAILGIAQWTASENQLKEGWRRMSIATHPDKNHDVRAETAFDMVQDAYQLLSNKEDRAAYDRRLGERIVKRQQLARERRAKRFRQLMTPFTLAFSTIRTLWRHKFLAFLAWVVVSTLRA